MFDTIRNRLNQLLSGRAFARSVVLLMSGTAFGQLLAILSTPIITRLYTPDALGLATSFASLLAIIGGASTLRYAITIPLPEEDADGAVMLFVSVVVNFAFSVLLALLLLILGKTFVEWMNLPELLPYLWLLPIGIVGLGFYTTLTYWAIRRKAFSDLVRTKVTQSIGRVLVQIGLGIVNIGAGGLIIGNIIGQVGGSGTLGRIAWRDTQDLLKRINFTQIWSGIVSYRRFPFFSMPSALLNVAGLQIAPLLIASLYGYNVAGWFGLATRLVALPTSLIGQAVSQVFLGEMAELIHTDPYKLRRLFYKLGGGLLLIGFLPALVLILFAPQLVDLVFGADWNETGVYLQYMAVFLVAQMAISPLSMLAATEVPKWQLAWDFMRFAGTMVTIYGSGYFGFSARTAILLYSGFGVFAYLIMIIMNIVVIQRRIRLFHLKKKESVSDLAE